LDLANSGSLGGPVAGANSGINGSAGHGEASKSMIGGDIDLGEI